MIAGVGYGFDNTNTMAISISVAQYNLHCNKKRLWKENCHIPESIRDLYSRDMTSSPNLSYLPL